MWLAGINLGMVRAVHWFHRKLVVLPGFNVKQLKPEVVNLGRINDVFSEGDSVNPKTLNEKKVLSSGRSKNIKILNNGELVKKLIFSEVSFSKTAREKALKSGSEIKKLPNE